MLLCDYKLFQFFLAFCHKVVEICHIGYRGDNDYDALVKWRDSSLV